MKGVGICSAKLPSPAAPPAAAPARHPARARAATPAVRRRAKYAHTNLIVRVFFLYIYSYYCWYYYHYY